MVKKKEWFVKVENWFASLMNWLNTQIWQPYIRFPFVFGKRTIKRKYRKTRRFCQRHSTVTFVLILFVSVLALSKIVEWTVKRDIEEKMLNDNYQTPYAILALFVSCCAVGIALREHPELLQAIKELKSEIQNLRKAIIAQGNQNIPKE